jgi:hypothetical protein
MGREGMGVAECVYIYVCAMRWVVCHCVAEFARRRRIEVFFFSFAEDTFVYFVVASALAASATV